MGKNIGAVKYLIKNILYNSFPMYVFGSAILSLHQFLTELIASQSIDSALSTTAEYYIAKLTPFPLDEFITSNGFVEVGVNIGMAVVVGAVIATFLWRKNV